MLSKFAQKALFGCVIALALATTQSVMAKNIIFDINKRKALLSQQAYQAIRSDCLAQNVEWDDKAPSPIKGLKSTEGYGSDNRPEELTWYVMVNGGRALAGDTKAAKDLHQTLLKWAKAGAFLDSDAEHDTYYALKRYMIPLVINYAIIAESLPAQDKQLIDQWMDKVIRPLDKKFDGDVDHNNHRYLADSTLMAWGAYRGDEKLIEIGRNGFLKALKAAKPNGALPLETRRGKRAVWYMRHALSSLVTIAEIDRQLGGSLYQTSVEGKTLATIVNYFVSAHRSPITILPDAAQNYIPGHKFDYLQQDTDYMRRRGHDRHYMAFAEAYINQPTLAAQRLRLLMQQEQAFAQRPMIDEFVGGNGSCFYRKAEVNAQ